MIGFVVALSLPFCVAPPVVVTLPAEVSARPGRMVTLRAESAGDIVRWATTAEGVDLVAFPDGKTALFCSPTPGRFVVLAWTATGNVPSEASRVVVIVAPPPAPSQSAFAKELRTLVARERDAGGLRFLADAYRAAGKAVADPEVLTTGQFAERLRTLVQAALPTEALPEIRTRIAQEFSTRIGSGADRALTPALRQTATQLITEIVTILEGK